VNVLSLSAAKYLVRCEAVTEHSGCDKYGLKTDNASERTAL